MKLNDVDFVWCYASLSVHLLSSSLRHRSSNQINVRGAKGVGEISFQGDCTDLNCLVLQAVCHYKFLGNKDGGCGSIGSGAALQFGERRIYSCGVHDLLESVLVFELAVWVVYAMSVVLFCDFGEVVGLGAILFHVLSTCVAEQVRG